jgi:hypothetical protein
MTCRKSSRAKNALSAASIGLWLLIPVSCMPNTQGMVNEKHDKWGFPIPRNGGLMVIDGY